MGKIKLTQNKYAIVDDKNYSWLNQYKWYARKGGNTYYAARHINKVKQKALMHRQILGLGFGDKRQSDHINHNGLDNRLCNIRIVTHQQNHFNQKNVRGYYWDKSAKKWRARIGLDGKVYYLGLFDNEKDAHEVYLKAKLKYHKIK